MLSVNSPILGHLASSSRSNQIGLHRAFARIEKSGDSLEATRHSGNSGQYSYANRLSGNTRARSTHLNNLQNATSYIQSEIVKPSLNFIYLVVRVLLKSNIP